jgi:GNAT superfamily N-acetyltransferase
VKHGGYEIRAFETGMRAGVLDVLRYLWREDPSTADAIFTWKYEDNPYSDGLPGVVALERGRVIAYRGFMASAWKAGPGGEPTSVLLSGDTVVQPDHRRQGLSLAMGRAAMDVFAEGGRLLLNLTASSASLPGYLKLGFVPFAEKRYLRRGGLPTAVWQKVSATVRPSALDRRIGFGRFGEVSVLSEPEPAAMADIAARNATGAGRLRLAQDERFFNWRYNHPAKRYVFYLRQAADVSGGYVVVGSGAGRTGFILDFADTDGETVAALVQYAVQRRHFEPLLVEGYSLGAGFGQAAEALGYGTGGLVGAVKRVLGRERPLPVLVRPARQELAEEDWFVAGRDVRRQESWALKEIASDSA